MARERRREIRLAGDRVNCSLVIFSGQRRPLKDLDVLAVVERLIGKRGPLHEIDDVRADVGEAFAVFVDIEEPRRAPQRRRRRPLS